MCNIEGLFVCIKPESRGPTRSFNLIIHIISGECFTDSPRMQVYPVNKHPSEAHLYEIDPHQSHWEYFLFSVILIQILLH